MKRTRRWWGILAVILWLVLLDQGVKVVVDRLVEPVPDDAVLVSVEHPVDIRMAPTLHTKIADMLTPPAERWGVDVRLLSVGYAILMTAVAILICGAWLCIIHGLFWDLNKPTYRGLTTAVFILAAGGVLSSLWADELFWGGSLDWISIAWLTEAGERMVEGHTHPLPYVRFNRLIFDIKDVYLWLTCLLLAIRSVLVVVTYVRCTPEERAGLKDKERHPLRNIRRMLAHWRAR